MGEEVSMMQPDSGKFHLLPDPASGIHGLLNRPEPEQEGIALDDVAEGKVLEVETRHHVYHIKNLGDGKVMISGHPEYCPEPVQVDMIGSTWGGDTLRMRFLGKGAKLEFWHPVRGMVCTSRIVGVRELTPVV
jgi:hypothetical protein